MFRSGDRSIYLHTTGLMMKSGTKNHPELIVSLLNRYQLREGLQISSMNTRDFFDLDLMSSKSNSCKMMIHFEYLTPSN